MKAEIVQQGTRSIKLCCVIVNAYLVLYSLGALILSASVLSLIENLQDGRNCRERGQETILFAALGKAAELRTDFTS